MDEELTDLGLRMLGDFLDELEDEEIKDLSHKSFAQSPYPIIAAKAVYQECVYSGMGPLGAQGPQGPLGPQGPPRSTVWQTDYTDQKP